MTLKENITPTFTDNLLNVLPTAIGRMPPSFFLMAHSMALYSTGTANCGTLKLQLNREKIILMLNNFRTSWVARATQLGYYQRNPQYYKK